MEAIIFRSDDIKMLDEIVANTKLPMGFYNEKGERIGTTLKLRRCGGTIIATVECVPEDVDKCRYKP
jgi:hypothetical protein